MSTRDGFLLIDKPRGVSSFSIVRTARSVLSLRKAGHAGTLDPAADGLLVLAFGKATRLIRYLQLEPKVYEFTVQFGSQTDTLDAEGQVIESGGLLPSADNLVALLPSFTGKQMQVPPVFSALKVEGKRSYDLARNGKPPVLQPREITIEALSLLQYDEAGGVASMVVTCSGGTYVRAIARDIAAQLGTCGFTASIRRTRCGVFSVAAAITPDKLAVSTQLIPMDEAFASQPGIQVSPEMLGAIMCGREVVLPQVQHTINDRVMAYRHRELVAVLRKTDEMHFHPDLVLTDVGEVDHAGT